MSMLRGAGPAATPWSTRPRCPTADPDLLAGPFAHVVVDEAQELTDAEWQMLLLRCPSRSFTDRRRPRPGPARVHRVVAGAARADRARPDRPGLAEHQLPDAGGGHGRGRAGHPGRAARTPTCRPRSAAAASPSCTAPASDLDVDPRRRGSPRTPRGSPASSAIPTFQATRPRPVADPGAGEGARVRPGRPRRPGGVRRRASRARSTATSR